MCSWLGAIQIHVYLYLTLQCTKTLFVHTNSLNGEKSSRKSLCYSLRQGRCSALHTSCSAAVLFKRPCSFMSVCTQLEGRQMQNKTAWKERWSSRGYVVLCEPAEGGCYERPVTSYYPVPIVLESFTLPTHWLGMDVAWNTSRQCCITQGKICWWPLFVCREYKLTQHYLLPVMKALQASFKRLHTIFCMKIGWTWRVVLAVCYWMKRRLLGLMISNIWVWCSRAVLIFK